MTETSKYNRDEWRNMAKDKARADKRELSYIGQLGKVAEHELYVSGVPYELAYPNDPKNPQPVKEPLPVAEVVNMPLPVDTPTEAVKAALPVVLPMKRQKDVLPNGRNGKSLPDAGKWFAQILPLRHITHPAWKALSKSATDVVITCIAKAARAAHTNSKSKDGVPIFNFTVSEGENIFKMSRPTFTKAVGLAIEIGFIECVKQGGITDGAGIMAVYRLSEKWKSYQAPERDNSNIAKARSAKQNPSKGALNALGKGALTGGGVFIPSVGKGALTDNPYFPG